MRWLNCAVEGQVNWPDKETQVEFDGHTLVLLPLTPTSYASVHMECAGSEMNEALTIVNRVLSTLSWKDDQPIINHYGVAGSTKPIPAARDACRSPFGYSPVSLYPKRIVAYNDSKTNLALALYREGKSLNSVPYQFLSYFKILNVFWRDKFIKHKHEIIDGINGILDKIADGLANERLSEIRKNNKDVGKYLYESGRCAISHAYSEPIADPDDVFNLHRLSADTPVVQAIASYLIENELKVPRSIWE